MKIEEQKKLKENCEKTIEKIAGLINCLTKNDYKLPLEVILDILLSTSIHSIDILNSLPNIIINNPDYGNRKYDNQEILILGRQLIRDQLEKLNENELAIRDIEGFIFICAIIGIKIDDFKKVADEFNQKIEEKHPTKKCKHEQ